MSWRYQTISKDSAASFGNQTSETTFNAWLEEMNHEGWQFVTGFAMKTQPDLMVMTFRQPMQEEQTKQIDPVMALG